MAMKLKIAQCTRELDDVFWLRHQVYVMEDGKFPGEQFRNHRLLDRNDAFPESTNIIAYESTNPVGTMRISLESELGLPVDEYFDFRSHRNDLAEQAPQTHTRPLVFTCAGMLAIRVEWKNRRDVVRALIKMAVGLWHSWGVTHVYATVNHDTVGMYDRLGFSPLADKIWVESIGNYIIPIAAPFESLYKWAFGHLQDELLDAYSGHVERLLLKTGERVFAEGDEGNYAYLVDEGVVKISRTHEDAAELTLATLERGEIFGELALIDTAPRSATATALKPTELIVLNRETFQNKMRSDSRLLSIVMTNFANRIRRMDELALVLAFGEKSQRLRYAVEAAIRHAKPDPQNPETLVAKMSPSELANIAGVGEETVVSYLDTLKLAEELDYNHKWIRFFKPMDLLKSA
jgi:CRP-like cAMP-binding protein